MQSLNQLTELCKGKNTASLLDNEFVDILRSVVKNVDMLRNSLKPEASKDTQSKKKSGLTCATCMLRFESVSMQREHFKSSLHMLNGKRKLLGFCAIDENGNDVQSPEDSQRHESAAKMKANVSKSDIENIHEESDNELPLAHFLVPYQHNSSSHTWTTISVWKAVVSPEKKLSKYPDPSLLNNVLNSERTWAVIMFRSGEFAAGIFNSYGKCTHHKAIQRYTTRKGQGGSQSRKDMKGGKKIKSAGSQIRRHNEEELDLEVRQLLKDWSDAFDGCDLIFLAASKLHNNLFFKHGVNKMAPQFKKSDARIRRVPFITFKPTFTEVQRIYAKLNGIQISLRETKDKKKEQTTREIQSSRKLSNDDEDEVICIKNTDNGAIEGKHSETAENLDPQAKEMQCAVCLMSINKDEATTLPCDHCFHDKCVAIWLDQEGTCPTCRCTIGTTASIMTNRSVPDSDLHQACQKNDIERVSQILFEWEDHGLNLRCGKNGVTCLHIAAQEGYCKLLTFLLEKNADPTVHDFRNRVPYNVSKSKAVRNAFREFMGSFPNRWDYKAACIPSPLDAEAKERKKRKEKEKKKRKKARQRAAKKKGLVNTDNANYDITEPKSTVDSGSKKIHAYKNKTQSYSEFEISKKMSDLAFYLDVDELELIGLLTNSENVSAVIDNIEMTLQAGVPAEEVLQMLKEQTKGTPSMKENTVGTGETSNEKKLSDAERNRKLRADAAEKRLKLQSDSI